MLTIHNAHLKASISTLGAEMHALTVIDSGRSIIWHGDETFWRGHSPILFPLVGSAWNGTLRHEGREYHLPKHGIVRQREWHVVEHRSDSVTLAIENLPEDLEQFPWPFRLAPSSHPPCGLQCQEPLHSFYDVVPNRWTPFHHAPHSLESRGRSTHTGGKSFLPRALACLRQQQACGLPAL